MISITRQYGVRLPIVAQYHPIHSKKVCLSIRSRGTASCHHPLHAEQQAIVGMPRIIKSVLVYDDGPDKSTELDQRMPVAAVAGQPGCLDRKYGADPPLADRSQQALEARPIDAASRAAQIIVDDLDCGPAHLSSTLGEPVLTAAALRIVQKLIGRRLADVDESSAAQVVSRDLGHRRPPRLPAPPRSRAAGLRPTLPAVPSATGPQ